MEEVETLASGLSHLFPAVPILAAISIACCLLVIRSFLKTHIFAIACYLWVLVIGNALLLINICVWRRSVVNIPIYADIVARFWQVYTLILYLNTLCLSKFFWIISRPAPSIKVYDTRRRTNRIDAFICFGIPLLLAPFIFLVSGGRYIIVEDFGPWGSMTLSLASFLVNTVPVIVTGIISITFSCLSCYNFWRARQPRPVLNDASISHQRRVLSISQTYKYTYVSISSIFGLIYGLVWVLLPWVLIGLRAEDGNRPWYTVSGIQVNFHRYRETYEWSRGVLDQLRWEGRRNITGFAFTVPVAGIQIFLCFGLGSESRKIYIDWWWKLMHYLKGTRLYSLGTALVLHRNRFRRARRDPNNFTPFLVDDLVMEDLSSTPSNKKDCLYKTSHRRFTLPPPPAYVPPTPHGAKSVPISPSGLLRQGSRPSLDEGEPRQQTPFLFSNRDHSLSHPNPPPRKGKSSSFDLHSSSLGQRGIPAYPSPSYAP